MALVRKVSNLALLEPENFSTNLAPDVRGMYLAFTLLVGSWYNSKSGLPNNNMAINSKYTDPY